MFDKLLDYYDKKLGAYNLVFKYIKFQWYFLWILLFASGVCSTLIIKLLVTKTFQVYNLPVLIPLIGMVVMFVHFNNKCKTIVREKLKIYPNSYIWRDITFEEKQADLLQKYLEHNNLDSEEHIKYLISLVYKQADEKRYSGYIWPGVSIAIFIPVWTQLINAEFRTANNMQEYAKIAASFLGIGLVIVLCLVALKIVLDRFSKEFLNGEYRKFKSLGRLLESVLLKVMSNRNPVR